MVYRTDSHRQPPARVEGVDASEDMVTSMLCQACTRKRQMVLKTVDINCGHKIPMCVGRRYSVVIYMSRLCPAHVKYAFVFSHHYDAVVASHSPVWAVACIDCVSSLPIGPRSSPHCIQVKPFTV
jgi:hypothetical protein